MSHDTCEKVQEKRKSFLSTFGAHILQIKSHVYFIKFIDDENGLDYSQNSENNEQFLKLIKKQKKKKHVQMCIKHVLRYVISNTIHHNTRTIYPCIVACIIAIVVASCYHK